MKIGNVSQTVLKRSILKLLRVEREESVIEKSVEEMCAGIEVNRDKQVIFTSTSVYGKGKNLGIFAVAKVANDLATRGAEPLGVQILIQLPPFAYESRLKAMVEHIEKACEAYQMQVFSAKAEINPIIQQSIIFVTGIGQVTKGQMIQSSKARASQDVVLTKWIGLEGMLRIASEKKEELEKRFVPAFMKQIINQEQELFALEEIACAKELGVSAMHQVGSGGILAALWDLAEAAEVGLEIQMKDIAIKQETIEVCEYFRLNPYQLTSTGSILITANSGETVVAKLRSKGIQATIIGRTTSEKERVILGGEEKRFIDRPQPDELVKIFQEA